MNDERLCSSEGNVAFMCLLRNGYARVLSMKIPCFTLILVYLAAAAA
jgi:hypothetical protein